MKKTVIPVLSIIILTINACTPSVTTSPKPLLTIEPAVSATPLPLKTPTKEPANTIHKPLALIVNEYLLSASPSYSTDRLVFHFASGDQDKILASTEKYRDSGRLIANYNNEILEKFGYREVVTRHEQFEGTGYFFDYFNIYLGDKKIVSDGLYVYPATVNASGTDFITGVVTIYNEYVLRLGSYTKRSWSEKREPYAYVGNQLLSVEAAGAQHGLTSIYLDDKLVYRTSTGATFDGPWSYSGHWALELDARRVIEDGQDINTIKGYEQSFQFATLDNRPFYFYQKNGKIGISFDGQEIVKNYDEIPHHHCCSSALLNPGITLNMVYFFARRGADWYYVEAYVPFADDK